MKRVTLVALSSALVAAFVCGASSCTKIDYEATAFSDPTATLSADLTGVKVGISDTLFGVFLEDINYASYALDDNMLVNNSFEATQGVSKTYGWETTNATLAIENTDGVLADVEGYRDSGVNTYYGCLTVNAAGGTLTNTGYDAVPMAVTDGTDYVFSAFIKTNTAMDMTVSVSNRDGEVLSESIRLEQGDEWVKYTRTIEASGTASNSLECNLSFSAPGTVYLDAITLETTNSTGGIKQYMYDAIADLAPKFIRFPGGCIVEGNGYFNRDGESGLDDTAYDWKNSIGAAVTADGDDIVPAFSYRLNTENGKTEESGATYGEPSTRKPNRDLWGGTNLNTYYDMEYGVGFYEYFVLCDNLGASAIPVLNCGYSCQGGGASNPRLLVGRHGKGVEDFIQDALDLVAFAKGDVNSSDANEAYWAGVRANMGHEEPFEMEYLGIGNEQWGATYYGLYQQFIEAFNEAKQSNPDLYGDIQLIVGNGTQLSDCEGYAGGTGGTAKNAALAYMNQGKISSLQEYGLHDHHYYRNYTEFFELSTLYDGYTRGTEREYHVFVGEFSANSETRQNGIPCVQTNNSWLTALSEAAYMTGLERNGDIVELAAYAPMFGASAYANQWAADMMYYSNTALSFTPNYYVQQLFMRNQGNDWLEHEITVRDGFETQFESAGYMLDKLYSSVCIEDETGDVIIKIVNASEEAVDFNVALSTGSMSLTGVADLTVLQCDNLRATSTIGAPAVTPQTARIGVENTFGYTAEGYSVAVIRVHVK